MKFLFFLLMANSAFAGIKNVELPASVVTFAPEKGEVRSASINIRCLKKASFFDWGSNGGKDYVACDNFVVNGQTLNKYQTSFSAELVKIGPNQYSMEKLAVSFSDNKKGHLCLTVSAPLVGAEVLNGNDHYSVLGFCTVADLPFSINDYVMNNNRKATLKDFIDTLHSPIIIRTK